MLEVRSLSARRGGRNLFRGLSFVVAPGAALWVTGPNGSGKSSLLRALTGLLEITAGEMLWQGEAIAKDWPAHRARIALIGHLDALKPGLTAIEMVNYWRALYGAGGNAKDVLTSFGLSQLTDTKIRYLSAGQKRRLSLARLLLTDAPLWLLDEPSAALDSDGQAVLTAMIKAHREKEGIAIIVTHHADMKDAKILSMGAA